ncbi:MAG: hypothetical protein VCA36_07385 [Opitutales bacterium]
MGSIDGRQAKIPEAKVDGDPVTRRQLMGPQRSDPLDPTWILPAEVNPAYRERGKKTNSAQRLDAFRQTASLVLRANTLPSLMTGVDQLLAG